MKPGIVFDMDDTLYPERQFIRSGFRAVAAYVERNFGVPAASSARVLFGELRRGGRPSALQTLCAAVGLPPTCVTELVNVIRGHEPELRLPDASRRALDRFRDAGWRTAVLTNGWPEIQARKVRALGLDGLVDAIVYATEWGSGKGKPEREPFDVVLGRIGSAPELTVFVGDDPWCDIMGARGAALHTILVRPGTVPGHVAGADRVVTSMDDVPAAAASLVCREVADAA